MLGWSGHPEGASHVAPNVFLVSPWLGEEDRFTSHWHYLLDVHPEVGQRVVDHIAGQTGLGQSTFLGAEDHPETSLEDRPDFVLRCADYDLLCEHKVDSALGVRQLERYCALRFDRPTHVVFVARNRTLISDEVLAHPHYRRPERTIQHFLWEDFYPVVSASSGRLLAEFVAYMDHMGMRPWQIAKFGDPFNDIDAAEQFRRLWDSVIERLRASGRRVKRDPNGLGLQISKLDDIHLAWVGPEKTVRKHEWTSTTPVLRFRLFDYAPANAPATLDEVSGEMPFSGGIAAFRTPSDERVGDYPVRREYRIDLEPVLSMEPSLAQAHVTDFVTAVLQHLGKSV
jgi:hypothetical protein